MRKIKGNDLIVMYEVSGIWVPIVYATSCEIDIESEYAETSCPTTGRWKTYRKRKKGWRISTAHLMGNVRKNPDLFEMLDSDTPLRVCFTTVEAHPDMIDSSEYRQDGRYTLTGEALVTRMSVNAPRGDMVAMSAELQGTGPIEQAWAHWVFVDGLWNSSGVWMNDGIWE